MMRHQRWVVAMLVALLAALPARVRVPAAQATDVETMLADAAAMIGRGDVGGALATAMRACDLAPERPRVHATLGMIYQRQGDQARAMTSLTRFQLAGLLAHGAPDESLTHEMADAEATLVYLVNHERISRGLPALWPDLTLAEMARDHSEEMRDLGYFSHGSPLRRNGTLESRFRNAFTAEPRAVAENVSRMSGTLWSFTPENVRASHQRLMASPGHCENILWDRPDHIGVGIAVSHCGDYWITENFALLGE